MIKFANTQVHFTVQLVGGNIEFYVPKEKNHKHHGPFPHQTSRKAIITTTKGQTFFSIVYIPIIPRNYSDYSIPDFQAIRQHLPI